MSELSDSLQAYMRRVESALERAGVAPLAKHGIICDLEAQIAEMHSEEGMSDKAILDSLDDPESFAAAYAENQPATRGTDVKPEPAATPETAAKPEAAARPEVVISPKIIVKPKIAVNPKIIVKPELPIKSEVPLKPGTPEVPEIADGFPDERGKAVYFIIAALAAITIFLEAATRTCALTYSNPIPTYFHLALLIIVPVALAATAAVLSSGRAGAHIGLLFFANGFLIAISAWYTMEFLPMLSLAVKAIVFFGLGLLPLAPILVFVAAVCQVLQLRRLAISVKAKGMIWRWVLGFLLTAMVLGGWYAYTTRVIEAVWQSIDKDSPEEREAGLHRLRQLGAEQYLLTLCHPVAPTTDAIVEISRRIPFSDPDDKLPSRGSFRTVYYRLTGKDCRDAKMPFWHFAPDRVAVRTHEDVGDITEVLTLRSATYDVDVASSENGADAGPGTAYAELTLEFSNSGEGRQEARCQLIMPPGGAASRLTVWIDGEEREAMSGERFEGLAHLEAERVRPGGDPALLTMAGPDRVLLQCFPVISGQTKRVKVGFSLPVTAEEEWGHLQLPYIAGRNFAVRLVEGISIRAESAAPLSGNDVFGMDAVKEDGKYTLRSHIPMADLAQARITIPLPEAPATYRAELSGIGATSELLREETMGERLVTVVLDTSRQFEGIWNRPGFWERVLDKIPDGCEVALFAGIITLPPLSADKAVRQWPDALSRLIYPGADGQAVNLEKAWDMCIANRNADVLWIHGTLPVSFMETHVGDVQQRLRQYVVRRKSERSQYFPSIYSVQVRPGVNRMEERLVRYEGMVRLPFWFDKPLDAELGKLFANMNYPQFTRERYRFTVGDRTDGGEDRYGHVVRLALAQEAGECFATDRDGKNADKEVLVADALRIGLVTWRTGAVVLDNAGEGVQKNLKASAAPYDTPTVPTPEAWAVLGIILLLFAVLYSQRNRIGYRQV